MLQKQLHKFLSGQYSKKEDSNLTVRGEFVNLCFVSLAPKGCVSRVFLYDVININKIVTVSSTKLPSYPYAQVSTGLILYLG